MPITESRLKGGSLTLDAVEFSSQTTGVYLDPNTDEVGDPVEVLSGEELGTEDETTWVLHIDAIQDFDDVAGFVRFCLDNAGTEVPFVWQPNVGTGTFGGTVKIRPVRIGGDVNARLTTPAEFPLIGDPTPGVAV